VRIGFFDWVEKKHEKMFGEPAEEKKLGDSDSKAAIAPVPAAAAAAAAASRHWPAKAGAPAVSVDDGVDAGSAAPAAEQPKRRSPIYRLFCLKCGEDSLHWMLDSSAGLFLSAVFIVACAVLLATRPPGCGENC
jgi:hypothetical protein